MLQPVRCCCAGRILPDAAGSRWTRNQPRADAQERPAARWSSGSRKRGRGSGAARVACRRAEASLGHEGGAVVSTPTTLLAQGRLGHPAEPPGNPIKAASSTTPRGIWARRSDRCCWCRPSASPARAGFASAGVDRLSTERPGVKGVAVRARPLPADELHGVYREHVSAVYAFFAYSVSRRRRRGSHLGDVRARGSPLGPLRPTAFERAHVDPRHRAQPSDRSLPAAAAPARGLRSTSTRSLRRHGHRRRSR